MKETTSQKQIAIDANEWFKLQDVQSFIDTDDTIYVVVGDGFEIQISTAEMHYRAELFRVYEKPTWHNRNT